MPIYNSSQLKNDIKLSKDLSLTNSERKKENYDPNSKKQQSNENNEKNEIDDDFISDITTDIPEKIIGNNFIKGEFCLLIKWKARSDGIIPTSSYVNKNDLKFKYPLMLLEFYQSKIKFK